jgi:hypothetical protein
MKRIRIASRAQLNAGALDFGALNADLARHFTSLTPERITQLSSLLAVVSMIESEILLMHLVDAAAITLQAEAAAERVEGDEH